MSMDSLLVKIADAPGLRGRIFQDAVSASGVALTQYEDSLDRVGPLDPKMSTGSFPGCPKWPKPLPVEIELSFKQSEQE